MKKIIINNFAAISSLESSLDKNLTVVIGAQASGKSTVSKLIYFCRRVKDYMLEFLVESLKESNRGECSFESTISNASSACIRNVLVAKKNCCNLE